jgi:arginase
MGALTLISVPYHLGVRGVGMGRGPLDLLGEWALVERLGAASGAVDVVEVSEPPGGPEVARIFAIDRDVATMVSGARAAGRMPVVVAGNCNACLGALGGIGARRCGIVWLDAHGDFHTPDTTESGFFDGMGLAIATGACWRGLAGTIPGFQAVAEADTVLVGVRDTEPAERDRLDRGAVAVIGGGRGPLHLPIEDVTKAVRQIGQRVDEIYLHVDLDVLDPSLGRANEFATPGGLGLDDLGTVASIVAAASPVGAVSFTAYNPDADPDGSFGDTAVQAILTVMGALARRRAGFTRCG